MDFKRKSTKEIIIYPALPSMSLLGDCGGLVLDVNFFFFFLIFKDRIYTWGNWAIHVYIYRVKQCEI